MPLKDSLRVLQHQNELNAFLDYERRLNLAYARSQDPHPRRWLRTYPSRGLRRDSQLDAPCGTEN
jgi:hypothetical protein